MTVSELLARLNALFPRAKEWLLAWAPIFRQALGGREGEDLRRAVDTTLTGWAEPGCPKPAQIAANLPSLPEGTREKRKMPWELRDEERHRRAAQLEATWTNDLGAWFEVARAEEWAGELKRYIQELALWCAQCEQNRRSLDYAIAKYNANEYRGHSAPRRAPDDLVDAADAAIFRARVASRARFIGLGGQRGDREPPWRKNPLEAAEPNARDVELAARRDRMRDRIAETNARIQGERMDDEPASEADVAAAAPAEEHVAA